MGGAREVEGQGRRKGGRRKGGDLSKCLPKKPKIKKNTPENSSVQASSSARDTNTEATSGEEDRKRKVPTNNRYTVNDIPLSEHDTEATSSISASVDGASVRLAASAHTAIT